MDPNRWRRLESLCLDALDLPSGERSGFLDRACGDDPALRGEVESVLREVERDPSFLERPLVDPIALGLEGAAAEPPLPEAIAGYRIERLLGRGGMGDVYLAIQTSEDLRQPVALKVIKRGMATDEVLARFRQERRILASLNHPNIARLLDAGATEDGRPYFLMELVEGLPLDQYCERRAVSIADRLRLFQVICDAVQHAHQNLVVHRDLKPSNIVVTDTGIPKLLDFGIGKVLAPTEWLSPGVETRTEARRLTPDYAAPEQLAGGPTTTATDVYSLGVLLYQLLTGRHPFPGRRTTGSRLRPGAIEVTADRPSAVVDDPDRRRRLAGDLDTIALKALRREPERRYQSARALADDLGRHLAGLPVSARPDTLGYRTRKFIRRHAAWVATATIAIAALVAVTIVTLVQSKRVAAESARVAAERDKALEVRGFLMEMFGATGSGQSVGDTVSVRRLLDLQAARLDSLYPDRPEVRADMMEVLADGYDRLGLPLAAEPLALAALGLRRATLPPEHPDVATSLNLVGWITHEVGRSRDAEPILREAVAIRRSGGPALREDLSRSLNDLGVVLSALSQYQEAETVLAEALAIRLATLGPEHRAVGITANNLAAAYYYEARYPEAIRTQDIALRALRASVGPEHQRTVVALANLAAFKRTLGDWAAADSSYRDLLALQTRLQGADHPATARVALEVARILVQRGTGRPDSPFLREADSILLAAIHAFERRLGPAHPQVGAALAELASARNEASRLPDARAAAERAVRILQRTLGDASQATARAVGTQATIEWRLGKPAEAIRLQRLAVAGLERSAGATNGETARAQAVLCRLLLTQRTDLEEARARCAAGVRATQGAPPPFRTMVSTYQLWLAEAHAALGQFERAKSLLAEVRADFATREVAAASLALADSLSVVVTRAGR